MGTVFRVIVILLIVSIVIGLIGTVAFSWTLSTSTYLSTLSTIFSIIVYILPVGKLSPIIAIFIASMVFRIVISIIKAIWQLIPISRINNRKDLIYGLFNISKNIQRYFVYIFRLFKISVNYYYLHN